MLVQYFHICSPSREVSYHHLWKECDSFWTGYKIPIFKNRNLINIASIGLVTLAASVALYMHTPVVTCKHVVMFPGTDLTLKLELNHFYFFI